MRREPTRFSFGGMLMTDSEESTGKNALYESIKEFLKEHPEALEMSVEETDRLFDEWMKAKK
jgi:hypothetical protein